MSISLVVWREHFDAYADDAAFLAAWVEGAGGAATMTWDLDNTHVVSGESISAHVHVEGTANPGDEYGVTLTKTGLTPGASYTFKRQPYATEIVAGLPANQFNQLSSTVTADASGSVDLTLRFTTPAGGSFDADIWFGDVHLEQTCDTWLVSDLLLDVGAIQVDGTVLGVTQGGLDIEELDAWESLDFPGKKAPVTGGDLKRTTGLRLGFTLISIVNTVDTLMPGGTTQAGTGFVNTVDLPSDAGSVLSDADYLSNVVAVWPLKCGGFLQWTLPTAMVLSAPVTARDKTAVTRRVTIEARRLASAYLSDSGRSAWQVELLDIGS
jgi:hypothetical protein